MIEALPKQIRVPTAEEIIRVGLVLPEDGKNELNFSGLSNMALELNGLRFSPCGDSLKLSLQQGHIVLGPSPDGTASCKKLLIKSPTPESLRPAQGIWLDEVTAGRGFHWQKKVRLCYPGDIEVSVAGNSFCVVNILPFENYLSCVASSEMSPQCPPDFACAQLTAARSWSRVFLGDKHPGAPFSVCNDDDCQRYQGSTHLSDDFISKVSRCRGEFLVSKDAYVCPAYYSKSCGGMIEDPQAIFGFQVPGLRACSDSTGSAFGNLNLQDDSDFNTWLELQSADRQQIYCSDISVPENTLKKYTGVVDEQGRYFRWDYLLETAELINNLKVRFGLHDVSSIREIRPMRRSVSGRITNLQISYTDAAGSIREFPINTQYDIRRALHSSFLLSSAFLIEPEKDASGNLLRARLRGCGWGHGVGLCQIGALGMALSGHNYHDILRHYYPDASIIKAYS